MMQYVDIIVISRAICSAADSFLSSEGQKLAVQSLVLAKTPSWGIEDNKWMLDVRPGAL